LPFETGAILISKKLQVTEIHKNGEFLRYILMLSSIINKMTLRRIQKNLYFLGSYGTSFDKFNFSGYSQYIPKSAMAKVTNGYLKNELGLICTVRV